MLTLDKRGRVYYAEGRCNGERVHQSLKTKDLTVAKALLRDLELRKLSGGRLVAKSWKDFSAEFLGWCSTSVKSAGGDSTLARYSFVLTRFTKFLQARCILELEHINAEVLAAYAKDRLTDVHPITKVTATQITVRNDFKVLHRAFSYAKQAKYLAENPVVWQKPLKTNREKRPFSPGELAAMLQDKQVAATPMLKAIVLMFTYTGLRISDVVGLRRVAVDLAGERIITRTQKRGKWTTLTIHPELAAAVEIYFQARNEAQVASEYVFSKADGSQLKRRWLASTLMRMFKRAGIPGAHPHRFRHTFAVRLLQQGASLYDVSRLLAIDAKTAEEFYAPYVQELQDRAAKLVRALPATGDKSGDTSEVSEKKVVTLR